VPGTIVAYATCTTGARVSYTTPTAIDAFDGPRPVTCTPCSGSDFAAGKTTVTCTASDKSGNTATAKFTIWVQYQAPADGSFFLAPVLPDGSSLFTIGAPLPAMFKLTGASAGITNLNAKFSVTKLSSTLQGTHPSVSSETVADTNNIYQYRSSQKLYIYRWKTLGQTQGTYQLHADLGDGVTHEVDVSLKPAK
jgi:hypothetical protein